MLSRRSSAAALTAAFLLGLALLLYPSLSNYWNDLHASTAIAEYSETVAALDSEVLSKAFAQIADYNCQIGERESLYLLSEEERQRYDALLNPSGDGLMCYLEIPAIGVNLPVYHGTSEAVLQVAAGHLEWTSLPEDGASVHAVFSGHRGLPEAKLFTELDRLEPGDEFIVRVLDKSLVYTVTSTEIVLPQDTESLRVVAGKNLCTLVTCTPYGINSHRLLVHGELTENSAEPSETEIEIVREAALLPPEIIAVALAVPSLAMVYACQLALDGLRRRRIRRILYETENFRRTAAGLRPGSAVSGSPVYSREQPSEPTGSRKLPGSTGCAGKSAGADSTVPGQQDAGSRGTGDT